MLFVIYLRDINFSMNCTYTTQNMVPEGCYFNALILKKKMNSWMFKTPRWKILFIKLRLFSINSETMSAKTRGQINLTHTFK